MTRVVQSVAVVCLVAGMAVGVSLTATAAPDVVLVSSQEPDPAVKAKDAKPKQKVVAKKKITKKGKAAMPDEGDATPTAAAPSDGLKFSRDIAPILAANCGNCHNATHRSGFNQTSFDSLMKGGKIGNDVVPGKPEESLLVSRIKGEEGAKMPPGQRQLSEKSIAKLEQWVKDGAKLDVGIDASAPMAKYAPSPEDIRKSELAKMSPDDRDKITEATGRDRLKKADPNSDLEMTKSAHFLLFAKMPKDRATALLKTMETQYGLLSRMLASGRGPGLNFQEKVSLYVFKEQKGFTEFARTVENQEVEASEEARGKLGVETPYITAVDPLVGAAEPAGSAAPKKASRAKKAASDETPLGPERQLAGLLTEQLASGSLAIAGKPPRWVTAGVGALLASKIEPRSPYYRKLRAEAYDQARQGWNTKASEALGDTTKPETVKAVGFAVSDWLLSNDPTVFANFVRGMLAGGAKLDETIGACLSSNREQFLEQTGAFVVGRYGAGR